MGTTYLPVNKNWSHYVSESNRVHNELENEVTTTMITLANHAASKGNNLYPYFIVRYCSLFVDNTIQ